MGTKLVDWLSMSYWPCSVGFCFVHFGVSVQITDSNCFTGIQNGMENCAYHDTSLSDNITDKIGIHPLLLSIYRYSTIRDAVHNAQNTWQ